MTNTTKEKIMRLLGYSEEEYFWELIEQGMRFLEANAGTHAQELSYTKTYWKHYTHQYSLQDEFFMATAGCYEGVWSQMVMRDMYWELHKKAFVNGDVCSHKVAEYFYAETIGHCFKEINETKQK